MKKLCTRVRTRTRGTTTVKYPCPGTLERVTNRAGAVIACGCPICGKLYNADHIDEVTR
jgi:hypothetical protein